MRYSKNPIRIMTLMAAIMSVTLVMGCGAAKQPTGGSGITPDPSPIVTPENVEKLDIVVYGVDANAEEIVEREETIEYNDEQQLVELTIEALQAQPSEEVVSLWKNIVFNQIKLDQSRLQLDITIPDEARLGGMGEVQLIETLTNTIFQLDIVDEIEVLVDGEQVESLMGHVDLEHPLKK